MDEDYDNYEEYDSVLFIIMYIYLDWFFNLTVVLWATVENGFTWNFFIVLKVEGGQGK